MFIVYDMIGVFLNRLNFHCLKNYPVLQFYRRFEGIDHVIE